MKRIYGRPSSCAAHGSLCDGPIERRGEEGNRFGPDSNPCSWSRRYSSLLQGNTDCLNRNKHDVLFVDKRFMKKNTMSVRRVAIARTNTHDKADEPCPPRISVARSDPIRSAPRPIVRGVRSSSMLVYVTERVRDGPQRCIGIFQEGELVRKQNLSFIS